MPPLIAITVTNKLLITTAYKYVALTMMLTNCNLFLNEMHLGTTAPIVFTNTILPQCSVNPPRLMGFSGSTVTEKYFFGFGHNHLANFWQKDFRSAPTSEGIQAQHERWSKMISQVGTNEVRQLALNWLANVGVDVATLEKNYPCKIKQKFFYQNSSGQLEDQSKLIVWLPIFDISWGSIPLAGRPEYTMPAASMTIFGPTSELIGYHLYADALMLHKLEVRDFETLLAIPDERFKSFSDAERSNLVKESDMPRP